MTFGPVLCVLASTVRVIEKAKLSFKGQSMLEQLQADGLLLTTYLLFPIAIAQDQLLVVVGFEYLAIER